MEEQYYDEEKQEHYFGESQETYKKSDYEEGKPQKRADEFSIGQSSLDESRHALTQKAQHSGIFLREELYEKKKDEETLPQQRNYSASNRPIEYDEEFKREAGYQQDYNYTSSEVLNLSEEQPDISNLTKAETEENQNSNNSEFEYTTQNWLREHDTKYQIKEPKIEEEIFRSETKPDDFEESSIYGRQITEIVQEVSPTKQQELTEFFHEKRKSELNWKKQPEDIQQKNSLETEEDKVKRLHNKQQESSLRSYTDIQVAKASDYTEKDHLLNELKSQSQEFFNKQSKIVIMPNQEVISSSPERTLTTEKEQPISSYTASIPIFKPTELYDKKDTHAKTQFLTILDSLQEMEEYEMEGGVNGQDLILKIRLVKDYKKIEKDYVHKFVDHVIASALCIPKEGVKVVDVKPGSWWAVLAVAAGTVIGGLIGVALAPVVGATLVVGGVAGVVLGAGVAIAALINNGAIKRECMNAIKKVEADSIKRDKDLDDKIEEVEHDLKQDINKIVIEMTILKNQVSSIESRVNDLEINKLELKGEQKALEDRFNDNLQYQQENHDISTRLFDKIIADEEQARNSGFEEPEENNRSIDEFDERLNDMQEKNNEKIDQLKEEFYSEIEKMDIFYKDRIYKITGALIRHMPQIFDD